VDVLNPDLRDLVIGLVSAAVAALLAWFYRSISRRRADRLAVLRHPVGGRYASKYTDEIGGVRRVVRDEVRIDQHGAKFTGVSRNLESGRAFVLDGSIVDERYLTGTYGGEHRADGARGVFFMQLDLLDTGSVHGLWAGFGAESASVISGNWTWRKLGNVTVESISDTDPALEHAVSLLNGALGTGFASRRGLVDLVQADDAVVLLARGGQSEVLGVATALVMDGTSKAGLRSALSRAGIRSVDFTQSTVGLLKSSAVLPTARGRGVGSRLLEERLAWMTSRNCSIALALAWHSGSEQSSIGVLEAAGFARVAELREYWREEEGHETFECVRCGVPCVCTAILMSRTLYDLTPSGDERGRSRRSARRG
jgi:GNAT superfamily N-acetyltransferase